MKAIEFEEWKFGDTTHKVYTNSKTLLNKIIKEAKCDVCDVYMMKGRPIAWDVIVDKKYIAKIKKLYREVIKKRKKK